MLPLILNTNHKNPASSAFCAVDPVNHKNPRHLRSLILCFMLFLNSNHKNPRHLRSMLLNRLIIKIRVICVLFCCVLLFSCRLQAQAVDDSLAYRLLDNAFGKNIESENAGIYFESIAYGIKDPKGIFTLPVYEVIKGGFLCMDGKKYEMQLGIIKALSDGKLMVMVDESSKMMYVDSVRSSVPGSDSTQEMPDMNKLMDEMIGGEGKLSYAGIENINGKRCHKIKATVEDAEHTHVYYWVEEVSKKIYLMAEWQNNAYNVYQFRSVGKAPKDHEYAIYLPEKEIDNFHGYTVIDNRYVSSQMKQ